MDAVAAAIAAAVDAAPVVNVKGPAIVPGRFVLIDGDYAAYYYAGHDETDIGDARNRLMNAIQNFKEMAGAEHVVLHLTATGSHKGYRSVVSTIKPYQENRSGSQRPKNWGALRDFMESYSGSVFRQKIWGTREADDGIAYHLRYILETTGQPAVVAMKDKDSQMFTGCIHLDWDTYELTDVPRGTFEMENSVGRLFGTKWFWLQMLMGDTADNIPGVQMIRGVTKMVACGKARAHDRLIMAVDDEDCFNKVAAAYHQFYGADKWADAFAENAALLWMRDDVNAEVTDFLSVIPDTQNSAADAVEAAADRLWLRVKEAVDAANNF